MVILFALLSMLVGILVPVAILYFTGWDVINFSIMFIVPIGAILTGFVCGWGYFKGLVKAHKKITGKHYLIGAILAAICFTGILYAEYRLAHISPEGYLEYSLDGDHVSNYYQEGYGQMTFANYTKYNIETSTVTFSNHGKEMFSSNNKIMNYVYFLINILGMILGFISSGMSKADEPYCDTCKKYKKVVPVIDIPKADMAEAIAEIDRTAAAFDAGASLMACMKKYKLDDRLEEQAHIQGIIEYCEECQTAELRLCLHELDDKAKPVLVTSFSHVVKVDYNVARQYAEMFKNDITAMYVEEEDEE